MKRFFQIVGLGLLVLGIGACRTASSPIGATASPRLPAILESGLLRVGLTGSQPPLNMAGADGEIIGFEVDIIRALAESMGLEIEFVQHPFSELLSALERGNVDLVISGLTITPQRNARVAFAGPYLVSGKSILTRAGHIHSAESLETLDAPTRSYAALSGSTSQRFVETMLPQSTLQLTSDYSAAVQMVTDGDVDGLVADYPACAWSAAGNPALRALDTPFTMEPLGIALPASDPLLVNLVQNYLTTLRETGLLAQFKARWLSGEPALVELP